MERLLNILAEKYIKSVSFDFDNFDQSLCSLNVGKYILEFDRMSMLVFNHNLSKKEYNLFAKFSREIYNKTVTYEVKKRVKEYGILFAFFSIFSEYKSFRIEAKTNPDFILYDNDTPYGIEITELTDPSDKILTRILDESTDDSCIEDIINAAINKHGLKAKIYKYFRINGVLSIASPLIDIIARKENFANQILRKYKKYQDMISEFNEFIILCDARLGIELDKSDDIEEIYDIIDSKMLLNKVCVVVLYTDDSGNLMYEIRRWD